MDKINETIRRYPPTDDLIRDYSTEMDCPESYIELLDRFLFEELELDQEALASMKSLRQAMLPAVCNSLGWPQDQVFEAFLGLAELVSRSSQDLPPEEEGLYAYDILGNLFLAEFHEGYGRSQEPSPEEVPERPCIAKLCVMGKPDQAIFHRRFVFLQFMVSRLVVDTPRFMLKRHASDPKAVIEEMLESREASAESGTS